MEDFREGFTSFWETLTGVLDDDRAKIIRLTSFVVLFLGIIWAGLNYFRAERISNLDEDMDNYSVSESGGSSETLNKLTEIAQTVGTMRKGGEAIAESLSSMNTMPFNIDGYNEMGLEDLNTTASRQQGHAGNHPLDNTGEQEQIQEQKQEEQPPQLLVKALMLSGKSKYAVIDYADKKGSVIRQGQKLPNGEGRVVRINQEGITVRLKDNSKEVVYTVK